MAFCGLYDAGFRVFFVRLRPVQQAAVEFPVALGHHGGGIAAYHGLTQGLP